LLVAMASNLLLPAFLISLGEELLQSIPGRAVNSGIR
jgi:hypothetical protein